MNERHGPNHRSGKRLDEIAAAARRVIIRDGLEATTMREISREGGFTTGVLTHYFPDKRALIAGTFAAISRGWIRHVHEELHAARTGQELVAAFVAVAIPHDADRQAGWRLWVEMWSYAGRNPEFVVVIGAADELWENEIRSMLERLRADGLLPDAVEPAPEATVLCRLVDGIGLRAWLTGGWDEARDVLIGHLAALGLPAPVLAGLGRIEGPPP